MERTYNEQDLEQAIRRTAPGEPPGLDFDAWQRRHAGAVSARKHPVENKVADGPSGAWVIRLGRTLMEKRQVRLGAAAAVLLTALAVVSLDRGTNVAWSMEQTVEAIEQIKTLQVEGTVVWPFGVKPTLVPFRFWVQPPREGSPLKMRGEVKNHLMIAKGDVVYECWLDTKTAQVQYGPAITDLKYWYKAAELVPWAIRQMPEMIQQYAEDWQQSTGRDPATGKERILATCTYPPSNMSFLLIVDPESKLLEGARLWSNLQHEGEPYIDAQKFAYNQEFADELFELPADMTIINERDTEESRALFNQGEDLFHRERKYAEAIEIYWQVYYTYPKLNVAEEALMMIGICHDWLGQPEEEIAVLEKAVREYPHLRGWVESTWFYLGSAYLKVGQKEKALAAFENCLAVGEGVRDPGKFPLKNAREAIAQLKGEHGDDSQQARALLDQAENLFHKEKKYAEAIEVYWQVYNAYPKLNVAEEALMMIGLCHRRLGDNAKEIEVYLTAIDEYPNLKGWIETTYFYLGRAYLDAGQKEKALAAFENCLAAGEGVREPGQFPLKDAREAIAEIRGE